MKPRSAYVYTLLCLSSTRTSLLLREIWAFRHARLFSSGTFRNVTAIKSNDAPSNALSCFDLICLRLINFVEFICMREKRRIRKRERRERERTVGTFLLVGCRIYFIFRFTKLLKFFSLGRRILPIRHGMSTNAVTCRPSLKRNHTNCKSCILGFFGREVGEAQFIEFKRASASN